MLGTLSKYYTNKAIVLYFILILATPMIFGYSMEWFGYVWGVSAVILFFGFANKLTMGMSKYNTQTIEKKLFWYSFIIRVLYMFIAYWFYQEITGEPFEFDAMDSKNYNYDASYFTSLVNNGKSIIDIFNISYHSIDDMGYIYYMFFVYLLTDDSIIILRVINCFLSAYSVLLIHRVAKRHFNLQTSINVGVFCMLMPNLIHYCGLHLKEPVMVFFCIAFIYFADNVLLGHRKWTEWIPMILCGLALFTFRTVLGAVAFLSFFSTLLLQSGKSLNWGKRLLLIIAMLGTMSIVIGDKVKTQVDEVINTDLSKSQQNNMEWRSRRKNGNKFAKYAGATVFAPLIFTIPFPTLVATPNQENQRLINGGNYVKNIMSFFCIFAIINMFLSGEWRKHVLLLSYIVGYLVVITLSSYAQSERFHQPIIPFELLFAAYGVNLMVTRKQKRYFNIWLVLMFVAIMGWQWFKLRGRDMY